MSAPTSVRPGQTYRWMGADVVVEAVDPWGKSARITIKQDGCPDWQKWAPLPFPPEAELVDPPQAEHNSTCWQVHDDCALKEARIVLGTQAASVDPAIEPRLRVLLDMVGAALLDHGAEGCSSPGGCFAAARAREVLRGAWS